MKKFKIGFDLHGVAMERPEFFSEISRALVAGGIEVHIITGKRREELAGELETFGFHEGVNFTHFFSITDYHVAKGTSIEWVGDKPWMDEYEWNKSKRDYCLREEIDLHLDDTDDYIALFKTPVARFWTKDKRKYYVRDNL